MPYKILIIEEDRMNLKLFSEILSLNGYEPLEARNALDGIRLVMSEKPHLIIMAIDSLSSNEFKIFEIMKSDASLKDIPVIALSPFATKWTRKKFLELGFSDCIAKPFDLREFIKIVKKHLYRGNGAE